MPAATSTSRSPNCAAISSAPPSPVPSTCPSSTTGATAPSSWSPGIRCGSPTARRSAASRPCPRYFKGDFSKATDAFGKPHLPHRPHRQGAVPEEPDSGQPVRPGRGETGRLLSRLPTSWADVNNFISQGNGTTSNNNFGIKVDHQLTASDRLTLSTFWRPNSSSDPVADSRSPLPVFGCVNDTLDLLTYIRYLRTITPTMFLDAKVSFSRKTNNQRWPYSDDKDWAAETGFTGGITNPIASGPPQLTASGYIILGPAYDLPKIWSYNNYQYTASMTWIHGRHSLKYRRRSSCASSISRGSTATRAAASPSSAAIPASRWPTCCSAGPAPPRASSTAAVRITWFPIIPATCRTTTRSPLPSP